mmetsp:Transcript_37215/g.102706  ORF Transcript_37215/g.102706 Transcript_37215/m.102706 type:complete len:202 (+) Transcript_37215:311-916(+)
MSKLYSPGSSGAANESEVEVAPRSRWTRLSAKSSSASPIASHQPECVTGLGKRGAYTVRRDAVLVARSSTRTSASAAGESLAAGGVAAISMEGSPRSTCSSSPTWRSSSTPRSQRRTSRAGASSSCDRWSTPCDASARSARSLMCGRSASCEPSRKRACVTICARRMTPRHVKSQPPSAEMSTIACSTRAVWSSTDLVSLT